MALQEQPTNAELFGEITYLASTDGSRGLTFGAVFWTFYVETQTVHIPVVPFSDIPYNFHAKIQYFCPGKQNREREDNILGSILRLSETRPGLGFMGSNSSWLPNEQLKTFPFDTNSR